MLRTSARDAVTLVLASALLTACAGDEKKCVEGDEGCACYPNETCNGNLACYSNVCVDPKQPKPRGDAGSSEGEPTDGSRATDATHDATDVSEGSNETGGPSATGSNGPGGTNPTNPTNASNDPRDSSDSPSGPSSVIPPKDSPVDKHGQLRVVGTKMVDESGRAVQLKGVSSMWLNWENDGYAEDKEALRYMRDNWNLSVIRAAMGIEASDDSPTYLTNPAHAKAQVETIVRNAIELGVYVIIDWHDHDAIAHSTEARAFFTEMAAEYGETPNVLYEIFNEPLDLSWSAELKPYHELLRDTIRAEDVDNVILLGTPNWDQDVDVAASSPLSGSNLMYTLHFYSCSHTRARGFMDKANVALGAGLPLFVSEWGAATADGIDTSQSCIDEAAAWHDWMDDNHIGWAAWKFDNCSDATCFFVDEAVPTAGNWSSEQINGLHPEFAIARMKNEVPPVVVEPGPGPGPGPGPSTTCSPTGSCAAGNGMDCGESGELVTRDCTACAILSCGTECCDAVGYFGAYVTEASYDFVLRPALVDDYSADATHVELTMSFDDSLPNWFQQIGAVTFRLTGANPRSAAMETVVCVETNEADMMAFTFENGNNGCDLAVYELYPGCYVPLGETSCWGTWTQVGSWNQLNVRTMATQESTNFSTYLNITGVYFY